MHPLEHVRPAIHPRFQEAKGPREDFADIPAPQPWEGNQEREARAVLSEAFLRAVGEITGATALSLWVQQEPEGPVRLAASHPSGSTFLWGQAIAQWAISHQAPLCLESSASAQDFIGLSIPGESGFPTLVAPFPNTGEPGGALEVHLPMRALRGGITSLLDGLQRVALELQGLWNERGLGQTASIPPDRGKASSTSLLEAIDMERERMGLELHDGMLQKMAMALQYLRSSRELPGVQSSQRDLPARALSLLEDAIAETRELIAQGQPEGLVRLGLADFLQDELERLEARAGIRIQVQASRARLPVAVEKALFRIAMEGVNNSMKHSQTQRILVKLTHTQEAVELEVQDWGKGFDPEALVLQKGRHFGIASMKRRAGLLGGTCQIISHPGQGTRVVVSVPYQAAP